MGLAQWLTDPGHPLTARVMANRIWQNIFGRGLVPSAENFGVQGTRPTYPELLDWLALRLIDNGWNVKDLIKTIVTSGTYRQRSVVDAAAIAEDPHNDRLARAEPAAAGRSDSRQCPGRLRTTQATIGRGTRSIL